MNQDSAPVASAALFSRRAFLCFLGALCILRLPAHYRDGRAAYHEHAVYALEPRIQGLLYYR